MKLALTRAAIVSLVSGMAFVACGGNGTEVAGSTGSPNLPGFHSSSSGSGTTSGGTGGGAATGSTGSTGSSTSSGSATTGTGGGGGEGGGGCTGQGCPCASGETQPCYTGASATKGVGACKAGTQSCSLGIFGPCVGEVIPAAEQCNAVDDDCNGKVDDLGQFVCGVGQCQRTAQLCTNGKLGQCTPGAPSVEVCDGIDNDCDGKVDDNVAGLGAGCATGLFGACAPGTATCTGATLVCTSNVAPSPEQCDGIDNDCDGVVDDNVVGLGAGCSTGLPGVCNAGTTSCQNGTIACTSAHQPSPEVCNNLDDNCNGFVDEGNPGGGSACTTGLSGACGPGSSTCQNGSLICAPIVAPAVEVCDGIDNDCNGKIDDGPAVGGLPCSTGQPGPCAAGVTYCVSGAVQCAPTVQPSPEVCDGKDNNCNGFVDEGNPGGGSACVGACGAGTTLCSGGAYVCSGVAVGDLFILMDQSGSMANALGASTRYGECVTGIESFMSDPATSGLELGFSFQPNDLSSCVATDYQTPLVPFAADPGVDASITALLTSHAPTTASTPPAALQGALAYAQAFALAHPTHKVGVALIADSEPNLCPNATTADLVAAATQYASGSPKVLTFMIGVSADVPPSTWNTVAAAGGTGTAYIVNASADMQAALTSIHTALKSCP